MIPYSQALIISMQALAIFLLVVALAGAVFGLLLIYKPYVMASINRVASRWTSTRRLNQFLDRSISIEHWFYRRHRLFGISAMLGATYIMIYFGLLFDKTAALQGLTVPLSKKLLEGLLDALVLASLTGAVVALLVGLFLCLRPSMLRGIEEDANRWISLRRTTKVLDIPHDQVENFVAHHKQRVGWLLLLGSIYLFFAMLRWLV